MAKATFPERLAEPGQEFGYSLADGTQVTLKADKQGHVRAKTQADENVLLAFGIPTIDPATEAEAPEAEKEG